MRSRGVDFIAVDDFRFGVFEGVDPCALRRLDVRVVGRGRKDGGFPETGANAPDSGLSVPKGTHRGGERRVVNEILIEVNVLVEDGRGNRLEGARVPRSDASGLINRRKRKKALSRNWSGGQMNKAEIRLAKAVAIVEITDTEGRARLT